MSYTHTLVPDRPSYVPHPDRVKDFVQALGELGATPTGPVFQMVVDRERVLWLDGKPIITPVLRGKAVPPATRSLPRYEGRNPLTGETAIVPRRERILLANITQVPAVLEGLEQYEFEVSGEESPKLPLLGVGPNGPSYQFTSDFVLRCCLHWQIVSTSDLHGDQLAGSRIKAFGEPVKETSGTGFFSNPTTLDTIVVPGAGCSRFWVEFAFGRLFPRIERSLSLLHPSIPVVANRVFGVSFAQGCKWG